MSTFKRQKSTRSPEEPLGRPPRPAPNEVGTFEEQMDAARLAMDLGDAKATNARIEWAEARRRTMAHARGA
ncbi:MAG: hypothetical protein WD049_05980 [Candidatus Paceibacterota bacterium]